MPFAYTNAVQLLGINAISKINFSRNDIGCKGLPLNIKGVNKLSSNIDVN